MTPTQVVDHFGGQSAAAREIGVTQPSVAGWLGTGTVPWDRQLQIEHLTSGALKHDPNDVPEHIRAALSQVQAA